MNVRENDCFVSYKESCLIFWTRGDKKYIRGFRPTSTAWKIRADLTLQGARLPFRSVLHVDQWWTTQELGPLKVPVPKLTTHTCATSSTSSTPPSTFLLPAQ